MSSVKITFNTDIVIGYLEKETTLKHGKYQISGWICAKHAIDTMVLIHDEKEHSVTYGGNSPDVHKAHPEYVQSKNSRFVITLTQNRSPFTFWGEAPQIACIKCILENGDIYTSKYFAINTVHLQRYIRHDVPLAVNISHSKWPSFLQQHFDKPSINILEVGSRNVTGSKIRSLFSQANYTGLDFYPGENVDIVGDAHYLSSYFSKQFDLIFSSAVFEHFAMPWIVAQEIVKLLKIGGHIFIETHYSFSSHERPCHFFQYSEMALKVLFSPAMGIECIEAGVSNHILGHFSPLADNYLQHRHVPALYCHSEFFGKKQKNIDGFSWQSVNIQDLIGTIKYPYRQDVMTKE